MFDTARAAARAAHSARNQGLACMVLLTMLTVLAAVMQLQTYCDPLALLPRKMNRGAADGGAFRFALLLVVAYYVWCLAAFLGWAFAYGYAWDSSIVSRPENVRSSPPRRRRTASLSMHRCTDAPMHRCTDASGLQRAPGRHTRAPAHPPLQPHALRCATFSSSPSCRALVQRTWRGARCTCGTRRGGSGRGCWAS